jgi:hypothetical protein
MRYRYLLTTTAAFIAVVLTGGTWMGLASRIGPGQPWLAVSILGGAFSLAFVWLLIARLRSFLAHPDRRLVELAVLTLNVAILVFAFAWVHHQIGLIDMSGPTPRPTHDLGDALYFSVVTITTLGYGDFIPLGPGRPVAALQAFLGYFILGILVSTGYQIIAPHTSPGEEARERREDGDPGGDGP